MVAGGGGGVGGGGGSSLAARRSRWSRAHLSVETRFIATAQRDRGVRSRCPRPRACRRATPAHRRCHAAAAGSATASVPTTRSMTMPRVVERQHVDGEAHPAWCARRGSARSTGPRRRSRPSRASSPHRARRAGVGDGNAVGDDAAGGQVAWRCMAALLPLFSTSGNSTVTNWIAAGPMVTIQIAGKMQKTSGNTILTPVFAAASSARWRRLVRERLGVDPQRLRHAGAELVGLNQHRHERAQVVDARCGRRGCAAPRRAACRRAARG